jgi:hypothetical protein
MNRQLTVNINDIVNFNFNNFNLEDKQQITAKITALSLFLLEKKGKYQIPDNARLYFDDEMNSDACYMKKHIYLGSKALVENRKNHISNYATHIENTAHEACHLGQDVDNSLSHRIIYDYNHFIHLLYHPITTELPNADNYQNLDNLIMAFYFLQPHELEAKQFSLEVFDYIINHCDRSKVNKNKLDKLIRITENNKSEFYVDTEMYIDSINDIENRRNFICLAQEYRSQLFEQIPNFLEEVRTFKVRTYIDNDYDIFTQLISTLYALINTLEVDYDDKLANDLFDAIAYSSLPPDKKQTLLYNIVAYTNFTPSPEQEKYLTIRCLMSNNFMGTREDLYASKEKTMAIINNLFDKEQLQLPTK